VNFVSTWNNVGWSEPWRSVCQVRLVTNLSCATPVNGDIDSSQRPPVLVSTTNISWAKRTIITYKYTGMKANEGNVNVYVQRWVECQFVTEKLQLLKAKEVCLRQCCYILAMTQNDCVGYKLILNEKRRVDNYIFKYRLTVNVSCHMWNETKYKFLIVWFISGIY
jgi:hypothetical protein